MELFTAFGLGVCTIVSVLPVLVTLNKRFYLAIVTDIKP